MIIYVYSAERILYAAISDISQKMIDFFSKQWYNDDTTYFTIIK